jgi:hypothetical protein
VGALNYVLHQNYTLPPDAPPAASGICLITNSLKVSRTALRTSMHRTLRRTRSVQQTTDAFHGAGIGLENLSEGTMCPLAWRTRTGSTKQSHSASLRAGLGRRCRSFPQEIAGSSRAQGSAAGVGQGVHGVMASVSPIQWKDGSSQLPGCTYSRSDGSRGTKPDRQPTNLKFTCSGADFFPASRTGKQTLIHSAPVT